MRNIVLQYEPWIRLGGFCVVFLAVALAERWAPRRRAGTATATRWMANLGLVVVDSLMLRLLSAASAVGMALAVEAQGWGVFNRLFWPAWCEAVAAVVILDFAVYLQHVLFHAVPWLWRFHRVHHSDRDFDVATGVRFHPVEVLLSLIYKMAIVAVLGVPAVAFLVFEVILNATSLFNHGNVFLPLGVDRVLRWFLVTPDMHRVHHSPLRVETDSNFGFNLPWWDRLFGTYRAQPTTGHDTMAIGLDNLRQPDRWPLLGLLTMPFWRDS
jgi:sterol desaturase/sphingolipid hydroxylase (fatty acid hydroxylase superfamily)